MTQITTIQPAYSVLLHSFGVPFKLQNGAPFSLSKHTKSYQIGESKVITPSKQQQIFTTCIKSNPGWTLFLCSDMFLDKPKHIAANICQSYFERDLKLRWLANFDKLDKIFTPGIKYSLVVIDAIFSDSSPFKRDRIYETLNSYCNRDDLSIIVIGRYENPLDMAVHLGMKPDFAIMSK